MPTYSQRCRTCGEGFELSMHLDEYEKMKRTGVECPKCHGKDVAPQLGHVEVRTARKASTY